MRRIVAVSLFCCGVAVAACDPRGPVALPGAWQLIRIDAKGGPWRLGDTATLHADAVLIEDNGTVIHARRIAADIAPEIGITRECHGSWTFEKSHIVMTLPTWCADGEFVVTWSGGATLTRERQGRRWVYRKVGR